MNRQLSGREPGVDGEPQDPQALVEVVCPDRRVPVRRAALEDLGAPDVVDEYVDVAVVGPDPLGQRVDLVGFQVIDRDRYAGAPEPGDEVSGLLDGLGPVVVGANWADSAAATGADDRRAGLAQGGGDSTPGAPGGAGDDSDAAAQRVWIR
jgi:hypothetical protein